MLNFLIPYRAYLYGLAFVLLSYAVYAVVIEPRVTLKATKEELGRAERNISVSTANTNVSIVDELNKYDANATQIKIDEWEGKHEEISIDVVDSNGSVEWVFFKN